MTESAPRFVAQASRIVTFAVLGIFIWIIHTIRSTEMQRDGLQGDVLRDEAGRIIGADFSGFCPDASDLAVLSGAPDLRQLRIEDTTIAEDVVDCIAGLDSLRLLSLAGTDVTDAQLQKITQSLQLRVLNISRTQNLTAGFSAASGSPLEILDASDCRWVSDEELSRLSTFPELLSLSVANAEISDAATQVFSELPALVNVDLSGCDQLSDLTLNRLAELAGMRSVSMPGRRLSLAAAQAFCDGGNRTLRAPLWEFPEMQPLQDAWITDPWGAFGQFEETGRASHLFSEGLPTIRIHDDDGLNWSPLKYFRNMQSVKLTGTAITDEVIANLSHATDIEDLDLSGTQVTDAAVLIIARLPRIRDLNLSDTQVTTRGLLSLRTLRQLNLLQISGIPVDDAVLEMLAGFPELTGTLDLSDSQVTAAALNEIPPMRISDLRLCGLPLTDSDLAFVVRWPQLSALDLSGTQVSGPFFEDLPKTRIESLFLDDMPITDRMLTQIAEHPELQSLTLRGTAVSGEVPATFVSRNLRRVSLARTKISDLGLQNIFRWNVNTLSLVDAEFSADAIAAITAPLGVTHLAMSANTEVLQRFASGIPGQQVSYLELWHPADEHLAAIGNWTALSDLSLFRGTLASADWKPAGLSELKRLTFRECELSPEAQAALSELTGLELLFLYGIDISTQELDELQNRLPNTQVLAYPAERAWSLEDR